MTNALSTSTSKLNIQQYAFGFGDEGTHHPIGKRIGDNTIEITGYAGKTDYTALAIYGLAEELLDQEITIKYQELEFIGSTEKISTVFSAAGFRSINNTIIDNTIAVIICSANTSWLSKNGTYHLTVNIPNKSAINITVIVNL